MQIGFLKTSRQVHPKNLLRRLIKSTPLPYPSPLERGVALRARFTPFLYLLWLTPHPNLPPRGEGTRRSSYRYFGFDQYDVLYSLTKESIFYNLFRIHCINIYILRFTHPKSFSLQCRFIPKSRSF